MEGFTEVTLEPPQKDEVTRQRKEKEVRENLYEQKKQKINAKEKEITAHSGKCKWAQVKLAGNENGKAGTDRSWRFSFITMSYSLTYNLQAIVNHQRILKKENNIRHYNTPDKRTKFSGGREWKRQIQEI